MGSRVFLATAVFCFVPGASGLGARRGAQSQRSARVEGAADRSPTKLGPAPPGALAVLADVHDDVGVDGRGREARALRNFELGPLERDGHAVLFAGQVPGWLPSARATFAARPQESSGAFARAEAASTRVSRCRAGRRVAQYSDSCASIVVVLGLGQLLLTPFFALLSFTFAGALTSDAARVERPAEAGNGANEPTGRS